MIKKNKTPIVITINIIFLVFASIFMYNFYKSLSGFIANGGRDGLFMVGIFSSYLLPSLMYIVYFYMNHVKKTSKLFNVLYYIFTLIWSVINLVMIFININTYMSNNSLGVYDSLIVTFGLFPIDMIIINTLIAAGTLFLVISNFIHIKKVKDLFSNFKIYGYFNFNFASYLGLSILMILTFLFIGMFINSFKGIENVLYDGKYIYLMLWVLIIPSLNLFGILFQVYGNKKYIYYSSLISVNIIFVVLLFIFEAMSPNFVVYIGKPLFAIAFSVSIPIEILMLLGISLISSIIFMLRMLPYYKKS